MDVILYGKNRDAVISSNIRDIEEFIEQTNDEYALVLTDDEIKTIAVSHADSLERSGRIEVMGGLAAKIIEAFSVSPYFTHNDFASGICRIIDAFYRTKNDSNDMIGDDDLIKFMVSSFNTVCGGSIDHLIEHELPKLAQALLSENYSNNSRSETETDEYE